VEHHGIEASNLQTVEGKKTGEQMRVESMQSCSHVIDEFTI